MHTQAGNAFNWQFFASSESQSHITPSGTSWDESTFAVRAEVNQREVMRQLEGERATTVIMM